MSQAALALDTAVRPPFHRCQCGRELAWHEHRASDGEGHEWLVNWFADPCACGMEHRWRPREG